MIRKKSFKKLDFLFIPASSSSLHERSYYTEYLLVDSGKGHITSLGYPCNYPNNANFTWIIKAKRDQINVNFTIFDLQAETTDRGCYDYLKVCMFRTYHDQWYPGILINFNKVCSVASLGQNVFYKKKTWIVIDIFLIC